MADLTLRIDGFREFTRALKVAGDGFPDAMKEANFDAANDFVHGARLRAEVLGGVARKAAESLRATRTLAYAAVTLGGARYPFAKGAEFGAKQYKRFKPWRGNQWAAWSGGPGYFLHPAIRDESETVLRDYWRRIDRITDRAFPSSH